MNRKRENLREFLFLMVVGGIALITISHINTWVLN